jgi:O-antigen/teichoic acid export membrane protein
MLDKKLFSFETSSLKSLFSDSLIYGVSSAINRLTVIIVLPFYAKLLSPDHFVNISLISNFFILVNIFLIFGMDNIIAIKYYNTALIEERKKIFSSWFWFEFFINLLFFVLFVIKSDFITKGLTNSNESQVFLIAACAQFFSFPLYILSFWYRLQRQPLKNLFITSFNGLFLILFNLYFLFIKKNGIQGYFLSQLFSSFIISLFSIFILIHWIHPRYFQIDLLYDKLKKSIGMLTANISNWVVSFSAIYFIQFLMKDKTQAGIYQIVLLINTVISFVINAFAQALGPYVQSIKNNKEIAEIQYKKIFKVYIVFVGFIAMSLSIFSNELVYLASNQEYAEASKFIFLVSFSTFLNGLSFIGGIGFVVGDKVDLNKFGFLNSIGTFINIILYLLLIPILGLYGAAFSSFLSSLCILIIIFFNANKYLRINYDFVFGIFIFVIYFLISIIFNYFNTYQIIQFEIIAIKIILEIIFIFTLFKNRLKIS